MPEFMKEEVKDMHYIAAAKTDIGLIKQVNQDSLTVKIAKTPTGDIVLGVICDGMGGLKQGEVASGSVVTAFGEWFCQELSEMVEKEMTAERIRDILLDMIHQENEKIRKYGIQNGITLGTTVTVFLVVRDRYYVAHVGDCRLYEITNGVRQLTVDQTYVAREVALGRMTEMQAKTHKQRNVLLQCVGVNSQVEADFFSGEMKEDAVYLLCSDGFRHEVSEEEMYQFCSPECNRDSDCMQQNLEYLTEINKRRQERDNISAILIRSMG